MLKSNYDPYNSDVDAPRKEAKQGRLATKAEIVLTKGV